MSGNLWISLNGNYTWSPRSVCKPDMVTFMDQKKDPWDMKEMETTAINLGTGATMQRRMVTSG